MLIIDGKFWTSPSKVKKTVRIFHKFRFFECILRNNVDLFPRSGHLGGPEVDDLDD